MALSVVKSGTNWSPKELQVLQRMKKNFSEMDARSGRPWKLGDDLLLIDPPGSIGMNNGRMERLAAAAYYIGIDGDTLGKYGDTSAAWAPGRRRPGVSYSVFLELRGDDKRVKILDALIAKWGAEKVTVSLARQAAGRPPKDPVSLYDLAKSYRAKFMRFRGQRIAQRTRQELELLRLEIDVLLGEAEEEAV